MILALSHFFSLKIKTFSCDGAEFINNYEGEDGYAKSV